MTRPRGTTASLSTPAEPPGYPSWLPRDVVLLDGRSVFVRPVLPTDVDELRQAIAQADAETVRSRFLGGRRPTSDQEISRLVNLDYNRRLAVLALSPDGRGVGIARYEANSGADIAEVAVAVDPPWRHVGLATALIRLLAAGAVRSGIHRFSADFFDANLDVRDLFADTGLSYQTTAAAAGVVTAEVTLPTDPADLL
jgi:GNAT superfamily N-acetyltransferase